MEFYRIFWVPVGKSGNGFSRDYYDFTEIGLSMDMLCLYNSRYFDFNDHCIYKPYDIVRVEHVYDLDGNLEIKEFPIGAYNATV
jgi:hypothetical protein